MLPHEVSYADTHNPTFNWKRIWSNFSSILFNPYDKEIIYKHLHMCLATNHRLAQMNQITTSTCTKCPDDRDQTPLHMFYLCTNIKPLFLWLLRVLSKLGMFKPTSNIRFIYFDNIYNNNYQKNICNMFLYCYLVTIWRTRKENLRIGILKHMIIKKVLQNFDIIKHMPLHTLEKLFGGNSQFDIDLLVNL